MTRSVLNSVCIGVILVPLAICRAQFVGHRLEGSATVNSRVSATSNGVLGGSAVPGLGPGIWSSIYEPFQHLNPGAPNVSGSVNAMSGIHQYGNWAARAAMWSGTPESYINLHPAGTSSSEILAASGDQQVGYTYTFSVSEFARATLWSGTAASAISLHPAGMAGSQANAMTATQQGGQIIINTNTRHAAIWNGSAQNFVDIHPAGSRESNIFGMHGNQQVGVTSLIQGNNHAALWEGTAASFRDMHPFPDGLSRLNGTSGSAQVGYVNSEAIGTGIKAGIWFGTPESFLNLHQFLPPGASYSIATCIEEVNGVYTIGGYARYGIYDQAVAWVGVPSPSVAVILAGAGIWSFRRGR